MSDARWSALLFAAALLIRLVAWMGTALFGTDGGHFLLMADWFREGRFHEALAMGYHPMYPLLIAVVRTITPSTEFAGNAVSVLLGSAAILPLYRMILATFGRPAAVVATLLYAFQPAIVEVESDVMTESTFIFFLFSSQWLTWRMLQDPTLARGAVLGAAAAAAYLTRPEGLLAIALAVGWPLVLLAARPDRRAARAAGIAATVLVIVLVSSPFVLWVKSYRGQWAISARQSVMSAERELGMSDSQAPPDLGHSRKYVYSMFLKSLFRLSLYGIWIPFAALGLRSVRGFGSVFYFSLPLAHLAGILFTLRTHTSVSERYLMAPMTLLGALVGCGMVAAVGILARRPSGTRQLPAVAGAILLGVAVLPSLRAFQTRRTECRSYPIAAARILQEGPPPRAMSGPVEQVAYLCGARSYYSASTPEGLRWQIREEHVDCYVYSEKDLGKRKDYVDLLRACPDLLPPVEVEGPPGTLKVYYQRVR